VSTPPTAPPPPPPPGPGQYYTPPPSEGSGNRTLLIVLIVIGVLLLVCIGGCITCGVLARQGFQQGMEEATRAGSADIKRLEAEVEKLPPGSPERAQKELELQQTRQALEVMRSMAGKRSP